ncbi:hypothetical protein [Salinispira pacifica]
MERSQIPDLYIEMLAAGELDEKKRAELEETYGAEELQRRVEALKASNSEILDRYPAGMMAARIRDRVEIEEERERVLQQRQAAALPFGDRFHRFALRLITEGLAVRITAGIAAAGLLIVFGTFLVIHMESLSAGGGVRAKGIRPTLMIYRHSANEAELLQNGDIVEAGDTLQISYVSAGKKYGAIVSIDGRGAVTVHLPDAYASGRSSQAAPLEPHGQTALPFAYQLDNAPKFERFFLVVSDNRFPVSEVTSDAEKLAESGKAYTADKLPLPSGFEQMSVLLKKPGE